MFPFVHFTICANKCADHLLSGEIRVALSSQLLSQNTGLIFFFKFRNLPKWYIPEHPAFVLYI